MLLHIGSLCIWTSADFLWKKLQGPVLIHPKTAWILSFKCRLLQANATLWILFSKKECKKLFEKLTYFRRQILLPFMFQPNFVQPLYIAVVSLPNFLRELKVKTARAFCAAWNCLKFSQSAGPCQVFLNFFATSFSFTSLNKNVINCI